jgi:hypothetical protein
LLEAAGNKHWPEKMVAQCIRLGLSTHQPSLTDLAADIHLLRNPCNPQPQHLWTSPFFQAVLSDKKDLARMLYECGACSNSVLFQLYTHRPDILPWLHGVATNTRSLQALSRDRGALSAPAWLPC